jgi:putative FmdB family regulatory protein
MKGRLFMPTYDYKCRDCGHQFEEFQSITAEPLSDCPECGGHVHRLIGAGNGLIFKGSGFYITDYKKSNGKTNGKAEPDSKTSSKSESKQPSTTDKSD